MIRSKGCKLYLKIGKFNVLLWFLFSVNSSATCESGLFVWQLYPYTESAGILIGSRRQNFEVASLADISWIDEEEDDDEEDVGYSSRNR